ncbi:MAG TPA: ATP-binding cassette domain-containing protein [Vicinamibacterales bacterium]|nr:ATP-binding cassette domain-containing protein [Vicinamibacterales bacterium]
MTDAAIRLERVNKSFGTHRVLTDVSLTVPAGSACCILGRSGTGKSVTLKHVIGLIRPDSGRIFVHGEDITSLDARGLSRVRRGMGFLFQNAALFDSITVGENVAFPLRRHTRLGEGEVRQRVHEKLREVGLEGAAEKMPGALSGGMRKRAGLARAMALDPPILLVDEPSAGLDPITSREIDELLLARRRAGTTLLVVTHNIPSARTLGDRLIVLHDGAIVAEGTAAELDRSRVPLVQAFMRSTGGG